MPGVRVGHATDAEARTGCTVVLGPFRAACDVRGLATGSRELETTRPGHLVPRIDAILLTGGSAFGLAAADGVVAWIEEHGGGYPTGAARVPIVPAAVIYDLAVGRADRRPDAAMGRAACDAASNAPVAEGAVGAGTGATVGKIAGLEHAMPGGIGSWSEEGVGGRLGALAVVNALGDVRGADGAILAGARANGGGFIDAARLLREGAFSPEATAPVRPEPGSNTTLVVVATDAPLDQGALRLVARAAATAMARRVTPVHTPFDGDISFAISATEPAQRLPAQRVLALSEVASFCVEQAIERAVLPA